MLLLANKDILYYLYMLNYYIKVIMRTRFLLLGMLLMSLLTANVKAQNAGTYYVYFSDGRVWGYPKEYVKSLDNDGKEYTLTLMNDSVISWRSAQVEKVSEEEPQYPQFTAFEFDDKLNDQLYRDVEADVSPNGVTATISGIGKWLTPSFEMDKPGAVAYVGGKEQESGVSRLRFANEVVYTLGHPDYKRLSVEKISDEVWSEAESGIKEIKLTESMLSTNAPSGREEGLDKMVDGVPGTIFHSTWTNDPVYGSPDVSKQVYVSIELPYALSEFQFYYMGRTGTTKYDIYEWTIEASHDGYRWTQITTLDEFHGLPASNSSDEFVSPVIDLGDSYGYLRFTASRVGYKNYLCLSEFRLYEVTGVAHEPELLQPAKYAYQMMPMGREVPVNIEWLTDQARSVPCIYIDIDGGAMVSSKDYYLDAQITFEGNGVWDEYDFQDYVKIKGRGNTSWSSDPYAKNPYRLKFDESVKPFGMKKGKNWNLIAQRQTGSLMTNPVAHKIARMVGLQTANDVVPVELYINNQYRGSYFFTQKVGMANNSVDFDDESKAVLFELDSYYDETYRFKTSPYSLPVNIKTPVFGEDETELDFSVVKNEFNRFMTAVDDNSNYERFVDVDMLVRYMLVNDLTLNTELGHPKSTFLSREDMGHMSRRYVFGPAWDFDWAYGYEGSGSYCVSGEARDLFSFFNESGTYFYSDILRKSEWVQYRYSQLWEEFMDRHLEELIDFVDEYYAYARSSFVNNSSMWGDGYNYDSNVDRMKSWLRNRANYIKDSLTPTSFYAQEPFSYGDLNNDGVINEYDMGYMLYYLFDDPWEPTDEYQADADADGVVSLADLTWLALLSQDELASQARSRQRRDIAWSDEEEELEEAYDFDIDDMPTLAPSHDRANGAPTRATSSSAELGLSVAQSSGKWDVKVSLANSTPYIAFSMDFIVPKAFTLSDADALLPLSSRTANSSFVVRGALIDYNVYRVIGYSTANVAMQGFEGELFTLPLNGTSLLEPNIYEIGVENITFVTENALEETSSEVWLSFEVDEDQSSTTSVLLDKYMPSWPADVYDACARLVRRQATSLHGLSRGVYIVNNRKVVWR